MSNTVDNHKTRQFVAWQLQLLLFLLWEYRLFSADIIKMVRFGPNVGEFGIKWDKSMTFQIRFQYILAETFLKKFKICLIWCQTDPLSA